MRKNRVVIDTCVLISAFAFGGKPKEAVSKCFDSYDIFVSRELLIEYKETPMKIFQDGKINLDQFEALIEGFAALVSKATLVFPEKIIHLCKDKECAAIRWKDSWEKTRIEMKKNNCKIVYLKCWGTK